MSCLLELVGPQPDDLRKAMKGNGRSGKSNFEGNGKSRKGGGKATEGQGKAVKR